MFHFGYKNMLMFSAVAEQQQLINYAEDGSSATFINSPILQGGNYRGGAWSDEGLLVNVDEAGMNVRGGMYQLQLDGSYEPIPLTQSHSGLADIISAPNGGWYFADFENDNIWYLASVGAEEVPLVATDMPVGPLNVEYYNGEVYFLNLIGNWPFGGDSAIYKVTADGQAQQIVKAPDGNVFGSLAQSYGNVFGQHLYVSDSKNGEIARINADGTTTVVAGLVNRHK